MLPVCVNIGPVVFFLCTEGIFDNVNLETDKRDKEKKGSHRKVSTTATGELIGNHDNIDRTIVVTLSLTFALFV